jgi:hypothetical protein
VQAVKEEGQILQKEFNAKTKVALKGVKDVVAVPVAAMKHFDFVKDHKDQVDREAKAIAGALTSSEQEDAIKEAVKTTPKLGFSKVFDAVKDVHQSTLPPK